LGNLSHKKGTPRKCAFFIFKRVPHMNVQMGAILTNNGDMNEGFPD